jgi:hypothetical protein
MEINVSDRAPPPFARRYHAVTDCRRCCCSGGCAPIYVSSHYTLEHMCVLMRTAAHVAVLLYMCPLLLYMCPRTTHTRAYVCPHAHRCSGCCATTYVSSTTIYVSSHYTTHTCPPAPLLRTDIMLSITAGDAAAQVAVLLYMCPRTTH